MAALHEALQTLSPIEFSTVPVGNLKSFLSETFSDAQLLIDSIPIPGPAEEIPSPSYGRSRSGTTSSFASSASEITASMARPSPPPSEVESLQSQWGKPVRLNAKDNPLGISVYKLAGKDGRGAWFARRSVHEGLGFERWKKGLQMEFPETMKVQGGPGQGNIRGIGGERRVEYKNVDGMGEMAVYHLSAQFPGPTTPRDFVTLLLTSDIALSDDCGGLSDDKEIPRHFMIVSKPCIHPDCPEREGFIRGQYQSVEFIREIPIKNSPRKSASTTDLQERGNSRKRSDSSALSREVVLRNAKKAQQHPIGEENSHGLSQQTSLSDTNLLSPTGRQRGKTISFSQSRGWDVEEDEDAETNPVEWIMLTRSDPGGSVPRFMVERGTPSSIVADASKFLDWACSSDMEDPDGSVLESSETREKPSRTSYDKGLYDYQTNGHLAGLDGARDPPHVEHHLMEQNLVEQHTEPSPEKVEVGNASGGGGIYGMVTGAVGAAGAMVASHTPAMITNHLPGHTTAATTTTTTATTATRAEDPIVEITRPPLRRLSTSTASTSSAGSWASALEGNLDSASASASNLSTRTASSFVRATRTSTTSMPLPSAQEKELQKLAARKLKLDEKLAKTRDRELAKKSDDSEKEALALAKAEEKHARELAKQHAKYEREVARLAAKKEKDEKKAEEKRRKGLEKDEKARLARELEEVKAERDVLRVERDLLRRAMGDLQRENTAFAAGVGRLGKEAGEKLLREVREEVAGGLAGGGKGSRGSSVRGLEVGGGGASASGKEKEKEKEREREKGREKEKEKQNLLR